MKQNVHLITLGVADLDVSAHFYEALGWQRAENCPPELVAFNLPTAVLGLYPRSKLEEDTGFTFSGSSAAIMLSCNQSSRDEVDVVMQAAKAAGARIVQPAHDVFWGGYGGYFADPDGHLWEVAFNPFSKLGPRDEFQWGGF